MTGKLEILPLFLGRLEFAEFRLGNPTVNLAVDAAGQPNWILDQGVVGTLASKGDSELPGDDLAPPSPRAEVSLGRFLIRDGTVNYSDARNGTKEALSDVDVDFSWRSTVEALRGNGSFVWRGEPVAFRGEINAPLTLLAGGDSPLRVSVEAAPANLSFEGMARQFDGMQIEGIASLKRALGGALRGLDRRARGNIADPAPHRSPERCRGRPPRSTSASSPSTSTAMPARGR